MKAALVALACSGLVSLVGPAARAETTEQTYAAALDALGKGTPNEAIDRMELLADQGVANADASLLRAAAYLARADGSGVQPGDLGRAAAALSEALLLRPDDAQAERGLEAVQAEIARRKSKHQESVMVRPRLSRAIATLLPEQLWATLALLSSFAVALGVVVRRLAQKPLARLTGMVAISVGSALMLTFGSGAYAAEQFRVNSQPAVVVVPEAKLTNENGRQLPSKRGADTTSVPEGATVYVRERREGRYLVEWGSTDAWLRSSELRLLAAR
jgi:hypothetical protein